MESNLTSNRAHVVLKKNIHAVRLHNQHANRSLKRKFVHTLLPEKLVGAAMKFENVCIH